MLHQQQPWLMEFPDDVWMIIVDAISASLELYRVCFCISIALRNRLWNVLKKHARQMAFASCTCFHWNLTQTPGFVNILADLDEYRNAVIFDTVRQHMNRIIRRATEHAADMFNWAQSLSRASNLEATVYVVLQRGNNISGAFDPNKARVCSSPRLMLEYRRKYMPLCNRIVTCCPPEGRRRPRLDVFDLRSSIYESESKVKHIEHLLEALSAHRDLRTWADGLEHLPLAEDRIPCIHEQLGTPMWHVWHPAGMHDNHRMLIQNHAYPVRQTDHPAWLEDANPIEADIPCLTLRVIRGDSRR